MREKCCQAHQGCNIGTYTDMNFLEHVNSELGKCPVRLIADNDLHTHKNLFVSTTILEIFTII